MAQTLDNNGNVIANGFSTNLNPSQYNVSIPTAISASNLTTPTSSIPVTTPNYNVNQYLNTANSSQAYTSSALADEQRIAEQNAQAQRDLMTSTNSDIGRLTSSLQNKNSDTFTANNITGANDKLAILNRLNTESLGLGYAKDMIPLQLQNQVAGQGVTDRGLAPIQTKQLRDNAIQLASNAYQSAIARNDYETAKAKAGEMIANKYDGIMAEIEAKKTNLENIKYNLTSAEKKVADATAQRLAKEKADAEERKEQERGISDIGMTLRKYGVSDSVVNNVLSSSSINDAIRKAGTNLQDPRAKMELESIRLEQLVKRAELAKVQKATQLLGQKTPAETKAELTALKNAKAAVPVLEDKMLLMDGILSSDAIDSVVGPSFLSRAGGNVSGIAGRFAAGALAGGAVGSVVPGVGTLIGAGVGGTALAAQGLKDVFGNRQNLISSVNQLTDKAFLDELLSLKERGGTLGQVTEKEGQALRSAASRIGTWEIKDDQGRVVGYNTSEKDFKKEIDRLKASTNRILTELRGSQYSADEQRLLDETFNSPLNEDPSQYFQ